MIISIYLIGDDQVQVINLKKNFILKKHLFMKSNEFKIDYLVFEFFKKTEKTGNK
jgi:hypothetical protein